MTPGPGPPAPATEACLMRRRSATRHLEMTCKSSRCSPRNSSNASTAPPCKSCRLQSSCTARCDSAPIAYSKIFSFCINVRATSSNTCTAWILLNKSRFCSQLARLWRAPRASLATFRSSYALHRAKAVTITCTTPYSPSCTLISGSVARLPRTPQPSFIKTALASKRCIAWMVASTKPSPNMSSRYCLFRDNPRTIPKAAS
mmetsp:Transcript_36128/g.90914  ORF Transcript_36128/g.90914 Transcript_36128/m.90914 type:complete len:202 (+) Transcript_36128:583-1188(+)